MPKVEAALPCFASILSAGNALASGESSAAASADLDKTVVTHSRDFHELMRAVAAHSDSLPAAHTLRLDVVAQQVAQFKAEEARLARVLSTLETGSASGDMRP